MTKQLTLTSPPPVRRTALAGGSAPEQSGNWRVAYISKNCELAEHEAEKVRDQGLTMRVREEIEKGRAFGKPYISCLYIVEVRL